MLTKLPERSEGYLSILQMKRGLITQIPRETVLFRINCMAKNYYYYCHNFSQQHDINNVSNTSFERINYLIINGNRQLKVVKKESFLFITITSFDFWIITLK